MSDDQDYNKEHLEYAKEVRRKKITKNIKMVVLGLILILAFWWLNDQLHLGFCPGRSC